MIAAVALGLAYLMLARVLSWLALLARSDTATEVERLAFGWLITLGVPT